MSGIMRTELQNDIDAARQLLSIPDTDFKPLPFTTDWHKLEERIYQRFCRISGKSRPIWLWEQFKNGYQGIDLNVYIPSVLDQFIPKNEAVWFMAGDGNNFFFYDGKVEAMRAVIGEISYLDEYYLISKKHDWLFCVNHHDILIGTGEFAIKQIRDFAQRQPQLVTATYLA